MSRTCLAAAALMLILAFTGEAAAQGWQHEGVTFLTTDDWCSRATNQSDGQGGEIPALELRPCGQEFPYLSLGIAGRSFDQLDLAAVASDAATASAGPEGRKVIADIYKKRDPGCVEVSHTVANSSVEGVSGFELFAEYSCPALSAAPTVMRTFTAYAQQKNGDVWVIAFDHPQTDITAVEKTMIRNAIATIESN